MYPPEEFILLLIGTKTEKHRAQYIFYGHPHDFDMILFTILYELIFMLVKIVLWFPIWISHVVRPLTFQIN